MNTYSPTYSDDDDEMGDIVEAYAEQEAADRPTDTDNARRRHLAEMTQQAFEDGLYETSAEDYAEALRRARGKNPAATIKDAEEVLHGAGWFARADLDPRDLRGILHDLADAGLFATARTVNVHPTYTVEYQQKIADELGVEREAVLRALGLAAPLLATARTHPTREQIARALREGRTNGLCTLGVRCDLCDCAQDYEDDLALRDADAVLALYTYQPTRDDLARAIASGYEPDHPTPNRHDYRAADAVLALFNEKGD